MFCLNIPLTGFGLPGKTYGFPKGKNQDIYRSLCTCTDAHPGVLPLNSTAIFSLGNKIYNL